jgi:hypothetical protein
MPEKVELRRIDKVLQAMNGDKDTTDNGVFSSIAHQLLLDFAHVQKTHEHDNHKKGKSNIAQINDGDLLRERKDAESQCDCVKIPM